MRRPLSLTTPAEDKDVACSTGPQGAAFRTPLRHLLWHRFSSGSRPTCGARSAQGVQGTWAPWHPVRRAAARASRSEAAWTQVADGCVQPGSKDRGSVLHGHRPAATAQRSTPIPPRAPKTPSRRVVVSCRRNCGAHCPSRALSHEKSSFCREVEEKQWSKTATGTRSFTQFSNGFAPKTTPPRQPQPKC